MLSLIFGNLDEDLEVVKVKDSRLEELGIHQGAVIRIIAKLNSGFIVKVGDTRISLDINTVKKVYVKC
jgi:Fe2+ transport system protein FeoA